MKKRGIIGIIVAIVVISAIVVVMMSYNNGTGKNSSTSSSSTSAVTTNTVDIQSYAFSPFAITVKVGTKVTWTNKDSVTHTITSDSGSADVFDSGNVDQSGTYSHTFSGAGTFTYHCAVHPSMTGKVVVTQ